MSFWTGTEWAEQQAAPPKRPSRARHAVEAILEGTLVAVMVVGLLAGSAFASVKSSSSVWVEQSASSRTTGMAYGSGFTVGYSTSTREPWAEAYCYPNASTAYRTTYGNGWVWGQTYSVFSGGPRPQAFELTDPIADNWTGGGADCTLRLVKYSTDFSRTTVLATSHFTVTP